MSNLFQDDTDWQAGRAPEPASEPSEPSDEPGDIEYTQPAQWHRSAEGVPSSRYDAEEELTRPVKVQPQAAPPKHTAPPPNTERQAKRHPERPVPPPNAPSGTPRPRTRSRPDNFPLVVMALFAVAATLLTGLAAFVGLRLASVANADPQAPSGKMMAASIATPTLTIPTYAPEATPTPDIQITPWDGHERFTVLLMGLDKRPNDRGTAFRTDSMILVSFDPNTGQIGMLSVPRDLYVEIPADSVVGRSYGLQRVNTAYFLGEQVQPGYGPKLAMQTVQYNLGIRVNDYMVYDFEAVIAAINAIGGIEINVEKPIVDYQYPTWQNGYETLRIAAGLQTMNGELALKYARTRHGSSDIDRARRQQQVILAVRDKILNANMLPELLIRAPGLWAELDRHIKSGLSIDQLLRLAVYAKDIPLGNVRQGVIDFKYVQSINWNGAAVLVPNRAAIGPLLADVFGTNYN